MKRLFTFFILLITINIGFAQSSPYATLSGVQLTPNPVYDVAKVKFEATRDAHVTIELYNILGKKVLNAASETVRPGDNVLSFSVTELPRGNYFARIKVLGGETRTIRLMRITP